MTNAISTKFPTDFSLSGGSGDKRTVTTKQRAVREDHSKNCLMVVQLLPVNKSIFMSLNLSWLIFDKLMAW